MRYFIALIFLLLPHVGTADDWEDRRLFNDGAEGTPLRVISSTDTVLFAPFIEEFVARNPIFSVEYLVSGTADIYERVRATPDAFDVVISSAMDLQLKLANDGFALPLDGMPIPAWAQWHDSLFAFTSEPATIVVNRAAFEGQTIPQTRQGLIEALRERPEVFRGKVGTYDVRQSGLGYLFATQDARASETYWRLMEVMGGLGVRLYCCSGDMIRDLADGKVLVAYNVLGSYAAARTEGTIITERTSAQSHRTVDIGAGEAAVQTDLLNACSESVPEIATQRIVTQPFVMPIGMRMLDARGLAGRD